MTTKTVLGSTCRSALVEACFCALLWTGCSPASEGPRGTSSQRSSLDIPCDANRVLQDVCQHCHSSPTQNSAPFSLVTYDDTQVLASGEPLWKYMRAVVQSGAMPLPPVQITPAEREMLLAWFDAGAPPRSDSDLCSDPSVDSADADVSVDPDATSLDSSGDESDGGLDGWEGGDASAMDAAEGSAPDSGALAVDASADSSAATCDTFDACTADSDDAEPE